MKRSSVAILSAVLLSIQLADLAAAQVATEDAAAKLETLTGIAEALAALEADLAEYGDPERRATADESFGALDVDIAALTDSITGLENDFSVVAAGLDLETFFDDRDEPLWRDEVAAFFEPLVVKLRQASAHPREIERLRSEVRYLETDLPRIEGALARIAELEQRNPDSAAVVGERLERLELYWRHQHNRLSSRYAAARLRLAARQSQDRGLARTGRDLIRSFVRERGRNLLLALLAFGVVSFVLTSLHRLISRYGPLHKRERRPPWLRAFDVTYYLLTIVAAIGALLGVLYASADWVLFGLAVLMLTGLLWAARSTVPVFLDQVRLMLNLGPVREGERLVYNGLPWRVSRLGLRTYLVNPLLEGGVLRLPIKDLLGLRSRPFAPEEPWFPCEVGHRVILGDGVYGEIIEQTPEVVVVSILLGSPRSYPAADFLRQHPQNLSINTFAAKATLSLDYGHREAVNTEIIRELKRSLREGLQREPYGEHLLEVIVELTELGSSALRIIILAQFAGAAAPDYYGIGRKLRQIALDTANANGWKIPYQQITVHQARTEAA